MTTAELLRKAAVVLDGGDSPLENWFLAENEVTLDQACSLAGLLAAGARIMARAIDGPGPERSVMAQDAALKSREEKEGER